MEISRENWIDNIKLFACVLVALGHFFQSMVSYGILEKGLIYQWFNQTIYYFHVPLFFICSGYLYQKYTVVNSYGTWKRNSAKKLVMLGVPYFSFSLISWALKSAFSGSVNSAAHGLLYDLFIHPMSPYWYLFALFFIFLITKTFQNKQVCCIYLVIGIALKIISLAFDLYIVKIVAGNQIWFVLGMAACVYDFPQFADKCKNSGKLMLVLFLAFSVVLSCKAIDSELASAFMGILGCAAWMIIFCTVDGVETKLAKYTMPVFLMHTFFAAGIRAVLIKLGIETLGIHIVVGVVFSFAGPVFAAEIMKKLKLDFFYQPGKYIKI